MLAKIRLCTGESLELLFFTSIQHVASQNKEKNWLKYDVVRFSSHSSNAPKEPPSVASNLQKLRPYIIPRQIAPIKPRHGMIGCGA